MTAARKPHSDRSDNKRTSELLGEIKVKFDNDLNKSLTFIAMGIGETAFFYYFLQAGEAGRHLAFLTQDKKEPIITTSHEGR